MLADDYLILKIDVENMGNGDQVEKRLRSDRGGGFPWITILDSNGKELVTSHGPNGNVGYPQTDEARNHFIRMLEETIQYGGEDRLARIVTALDVHRGLDVSPTTLDFRDSFIIGRPAPTLNAVIKSLIPISSVRVSCGGTSVSARVVKRSQHEWELIAVPCDELGEGSFAVRLKVYAEFENATSPPLTVLCRGEVLPDARVHPKSVEFGIVERGQLAEQSVCFVSATEQPFVLKVVDLPEEVTVHSRETGEDTVHEVFFSYHPPKSGQLEATARFVAKYPTGDQTSIALKLRATIISP